VFSQQNKVIITQITLHYSLYKITMVLRFGITLFPLIQLLNVLEFTRVKRS